jgi:hypothetical protein
MNTNFITLRFIGGGHDPIFYSEAPSLLVNVYNAHLNSHGSVYPDYI